MGSAAGFARRLGHGRATSDLHPAVASLAGRLGGPRSGARCRPRLVWACSGGGIGDLDLGGPVPDLSGLPGGLIWIAGWASNHLAYAFNSGPSGTSPSLR